MINRINIFDDVELVILELLFNAGSILYKLGIILVILAGALFIYARTKSPVENSTILLKKFSAGFFFSFTLIWFVTLLVYTNPLSNSPATADQLMKLAEAESTLLQLRAANVVAKEPLVVDAELSQRWIDSMRKQVESGLTLAEYRLLVKEYNSLNIGEPKMKQWFSENSSETVYDEIKANMLSVIAKHSKQAPSYSADMNPPSSSSSEETLPVASAEAEPQSQLINSLPGDDEQKNMDAQVSELLN